MPVVFAQPAPSGAFRQIADQGNPQAFLQAYTALSGQLQNRYANDAETSARERLGYANLAADTALRSRALGIQESELIARPEMQIAAIQAHSRAQMDQFLMQQEFTARDQQELNRQRNSLGELMQKRESGEITESEFYQMAGRVAPRVNTLQEREKFTQQAALNEQRKMQASLFETQKNQREGLLAFQQAELDGKLDYHIPPKYASKLAEIMQDAHPELKVGSPEYDAVSKSEADERGWAQRYAKKADGTPVYEKDVHGDGSGSSSSSSGSGKPMTERDKLTLAQRVINDTINKFERDGKMDYTQDELMNKAKKHMDAISALSGGQPQEAKVELEKKRDLQVSKLEMSIDRIISSAETSPQAKQFVAGILGEAKKLMEKYPPDQMPNSIKKRIETLLTQADQYDLFPKADAEEAAAKRGPTLKKSADGGYEGFQRTGGTGTPFKEGTGLAKLYEQGLARMGDIFSFHGTPVEGGGLGGIIRGSK